MLQFEVASTSPLALHHDHEDLPEWHGTNIIENVSQRTHEAMIAVRELVIKTELSIEEIAEHFGIHHFGIHIMKRSLSECKIVLTSDNHLEIHRENQEHPTRFRVEQKSLLVA